MRFITFKNIVIVASILVVVAIPALQTWAATPVYINVLNYGADPTGVNDSSNAIIHAMNAAEGFSDTITQNNCKEVYFPRGTYLIKRPRVIHLTYQSGGCSIYGDGPTLSVLKVDPSVASDYLIYHYEPCDGPLAEWNVHDLGFVGPGSGTSFGWLYDWGGPDPTSSCTWVSSGTGGLMFRNIKISGMNEGLRNNGTQAADTFLFMSVTMTDVNTPFHLLDPQSVPMDIYSSSICANKDVFLFDQQGAAGWDIYGSYLCTKGNSIFHFASNFHGGVDNANLTARSTTFDILSSTGQLMRHDESSSVTQFICENCTMGMIQNGVTQNVVTLVANNRFLWYRGSFAGHVTLSDTVSTGLYVAPPIFTLRNTNWTTDSVSNSITKRGTTIVTFRSIMVNGSHVPDQ
jgi:Pectate lyase superfamily protein